MSASLPNAMAWQIFKKDWKLLWPLAIASMAGGVIIDVLMYRFHHSGGGHGLEALVGLIALGVVIALTLLIVLAIHQEAMEKMKTVMESAGAQIRPLLTPQQQEKFDAMKKAHDDMHKAMQEMHNAEKK